MPLVKKIRRGESLEEPHWKFFEFCRRRHQIYLDRAAGAAAPWTDDPILSEYRFTNVFRELDRNTIWFRKMVRDPLSEIPEVLLATALFRLTNRIETGEAMFCQSTIVGRPLTSGVVRPPDFMKVFSDIAWPTAFEIFLVEKDVGILRDAIIRHCGDRGPFVTGAYIMSSPQGYDKLDGVLNVLGKFAMTDWRDVSVAMRRDNWSLQQAHEWLRKVPYFGPFHSYEMVSDLRHTSLLRAAVDVGSWASIGPGCRRGLNRARGRNPHDKSVDTDTMLREMRGLQRLASCDRRAWPQLDPENWPRWEMREVEHSLCEFDKYERVRLGEGRPRQKYRY